MRITPILLWESLEKAASEFNYTFYIKTEDGRPHTHLDFAKLFDLQFQILKSSSAPKRKKKKEVLNEEQLVWWEEFKKAYPRKDEISAAKPRFAEKIGDEQTFNTFLSAVKNYARQKINTEAQYIKLAATFMNCWEAFIPSVTEPSPSFYDPKDYGL